MVAYVKAKKRTRSLATPERLTGVGPGPLQRQVLRVLHGIKLAGEGPVNAQQIADVLVASGFPTISSSVSAALSGMGVCGRRYWVCKYPFNTYIITRNGLAWL